MSNRTHSTHVDATQGVTPVPEVGTTTIAEGVSTGAASNTTGPANSDPASTILPITAPHGPGRVGTSPNPTSFGGSESSSPKRQSTVFHPPTTPGINTQQQYQSSTAPRQQQQQSSHLLDSQGDPVPAGRGSAGGVSSTSIGSSGGLIGGHSSRPSPPVSQSATRQSSGQATPQLGLSGDVGLLGEMFQSYPGSGQGSGHFSSNSPRPAFASATGGAGSSGSGPMFQALPLPNSGNATPASMASATESNTSLYFGQDPPLFQFGSNVSSAEHSRSTTRSGSFSTSNYAGYGTPGGVGRSMTPGGGTPSLLVPPPGNALMHNSHGSGSSGGLLGSILPTTSSQASSQGQNDGGVSSGANSSMSSRRASWGRIDSPGRSGHSGHSGGSASVFSWHQPGTGNSGVGGSTTQQPPPPVMEFAAPKLYPVSGSHHRLSLGDMNLSSGAPPPNMSSTLPPERIMAAISTGSHAPPFTPQQQQREDQPGVGKARSEQENDHLENSEESFLLSPSEEPPAFDSSRTSKGQDDLHSALSESPVKNPPLVEESTESSEADAA